MLVLLSVAFAFWQLWLVYSTHPELAEQLKTLSWQSLKKRQILQLPVELPLYLLATVAVLWVQRWLRGSRLYLSSSQLRHSSGLPLWLGNWLKQNWALSLDEFRHGRMVFALAGLARANTSLASFVLRWKAADNDKTHWLTAYLVRRQLTPASWFLIGQAAREAVHPPKGLFWRSLNPWTTPAGKAVLQEAFDALPLVTALRAQGVPLPAFSTAKRQMGDGIDLMAYPRMKTMVLSFFGLLIGAGLAYHFMRHQHFFEAPAVWIWAVFGACCALASWFWLSEEQAPAAPSFKPTQGLMAVLHGIAATLMAPSALLGLNLALGARQWVSVTVIKTPLQLVPDDKTIPPFSPSQAREFWAELPVQSDRQIAVHKGIFGTWQYDSEPLEGEVYAFYKKYSQPPVPAKDVARK